MKWNCCHAAARGTSHRLMGTPCQDRTWWEEFGGVTAAALADGAGSAAHAEIGAETAVRTVCRHITRHYDRLAANPDGGAVGQEILSVLTEALEEKARELGTEVSQLACTLQAVGIRDGRAFLIHIGDGVIGYTHALTGKVGVLSAPDNGEYKNRTTFVTSPDAALRMRLYRCSVEKIGSFLLMSDGTADSLYRKAGNTLDSALDTLSLLCALQDPEVASVFLDSYLRDVIITHTDDDCSLMIAALPMSGERCLKLDSALQCDVYGTASRKACSRLNAVLSLCTEAPRTVNQLCRLTHTRKAKVNQRLMRLMDSGVLRCRQGRYFAVPAVPAA